MTQLDIFLNIYTIEKRVKVLG